MEIKFNGVQSFLDLARYMVKQEQRIKELEKENYELDKELLRLRSQLLMPDPNDGITRMEVTE